MNSLVTQSLSAIPPGTKPNGYSAGLLAVEVEDAMIKLFQPELNIAGSNGEKKVPKQFL
jgi:hypothetical protein